MFWLGLGIGGLVAYIVYLKYENIQLKEDLETIGQFLIDKGIASEVLMPVGEENDDEEEGANY